MYTEQHTQWAIQISTMSDQLKESEKKVAKLTMQAKRCLAKHRPSINAELAEEQLMAKNLKESISSETWKFFEQVHRGYKGSPVAISSDVDHEKATIIQELRIAVSSQAKIILTAIGLAFSDDADLLDGEIPLVSMIQAFESKGDYLEVL